MRIVEADFYLDGGTVYVDIEDQGSVTRLLLGYKLPWDGRPRHIFKTEDGNTRRILIGTEEEREACLTVKTLLEQEYGESVVREALEHEPAREVAWQAHCAKQLFRSTEGYKDPYPLPFRGQWTMVYDFVEKARREGKI